MAITAALVKELRERTGAGMMECKKALVETDGDIELAIENMRKSGQAKAAKKAGRIAAEGVIVIQASDDGKKVAMAEVNCETDFVAKDENFLSFANAVAERVLNSDVADVEELNALPLHEGEDITVEEARQALVSKIGENMNVRRFIRLESDGQIASYRHGVRIGVLVDLSGGDEELGKDLAMHVAASNPVCVEEKMFPRICWQRKRRSSKPRPRRVASRTTSSRRWWKAVFANIWLKSPSPDRLLSRTQIPLWVNCWIPPMPLSTASCASKWVKVSRKKQENFAEEVMAQVRGE